MFRPILTFIGQSATFNDSGSLSVKVRPHVFMEEKFLAFTDKQSEFYKLVLQCEESEYTFFPKAIDTFSEIVSTRELDSGRKVKRIEKDRDFFIRLSNG